MILSLALKYWAGLHAAILIQPADQAVPPVTLTSSCRLDCHTSLAYHFDDLLSAVLALSQGLDPISTWRQSLSRR